MYLGWGFCKVLWSSVSINADFILEFDSRRCDPGSKVVSKGALVGSAFNLNFLLYYKMRRTVAGVLNHVPAYYLPIMQLLVTFYVIFFPRRKRVGLLDGVWETMKTPFGRVSFRENIVGDFATSFVKVNTGECFFLLRFRGDDEQSKLVNMRVRLSFAPRTFSPFSHEELLVFFHLNYK